MRRFAATAVVLTALAACASGQPSAGPTAAEQLRLFTKNRDLLEGLVEHTVALANADTPVAKVRACHASARDVGRALKDAADRDDADRIAELSEHLTAVIRHGLAPTIGAARDVIPAGTPAAKELQEVSALAADDAKAFELAIPALGKAGASGRVKDARTKLREAVGELTKP